MKYEYLQAVWSDIGPETTKELNELGEQGWELITTNTVFGTINIIYMFKREKTIKTLLQEERKMI